MNAVIDTQATTFIRVAEVWVPRDGHLVNAGGDYAGCDSFARASETERFAKGEGLPGRAWDLQRPIVLTQFDGSYFKRSQAAAAVGLVSAVAIPVFADDTLKAVLVLLCGTDVDHHGAIELWQESGGRLSLVDGYYGNAHAFEDASRAISFAVGQGLPGAVQAANTPILMRDIARSTSFLRSAEAASIGMTTGLGVPVPTPGKAGYVLTLLSAADTPIAHRFEIWDARPERVGAERSAQLIDGLCRREGALWPQENPPVNPTRAHAWKGPIGQVLGSGLPFVQRGGGGLPADYSALVALPIYQDVDLAYVIAWYL